MIANPLLFLWPEKKLKLKQEAKKKKKQRDDSYKHEYYKTNILFFLKKKCKVIKSCEVKSSTNQMLKDEIKKKITQNNLKNKDGKKTLIEG